MEPEIDQNKEGLSAEIDAILAATQPILLKAGTMDMDRLLDATHAMWDGLNEDEIQAIVQAMNGK